MIITIHPFHLSSELDDDENSELYDFSGARYSRNNKSIGIRINGAPRAVFIRVKLFIGIEVPIDMGLEMERVIFYMVLNDYRLGGISPHPPVHVAQATVFDKRLVVRPTIEVHGFSTYRARESHDCEHRNSYR